MSTEFCPQCRQPMMEVRNGVRLPPLKARIFDIIRRAGIDGVMIDDINAIAFDGQASAVTIRNHIRQLNELFADSSIRISGAYYPRGFYRIVRTRNAVPRNFSRASGEALPRLVGKYSSKCGEPT